MQMGIQIGIQMGIQIGIQMGIQIEIQMGIQKRIQSGFRGESIVDLDINLETNLAMNSDKGRIETKDRVRGQREIRISRNIY